MKTDYFVRETLMTDFIARRAWGLVRLLFRTKLSPRCTGCAISSRIHPLDGRGRCAECGRAGSMPAKEVGDERNTDILDRYLGASSTSEYDALVMLSGGKDSAYLAHRLRTHRPERTFLAVMVDNGFMSPFALENARRTAERLDLELRILRIEAEVAREIFRAGLLNIDKQSRYSLVDTLDGHLTFCATRKLAVELGTQTIFCGLGYEQCLNVFGEVDEVLPYRTQVAYLDSLDIDFERELSATAYALWYEPTGDGREPRVVMPMTVWRPSEQQIYGYVQEHDLATKRLSPLLTNNRLIPVTGLAELWHFGHSSWEEEFCSQIRDGRQDRTYWRNIFEMLEVASTSDLLLNNTMKQTMAQLGLTKQDLVAR